MITFDQLEHTGAYLAGGDPSSAQAAFVFEDPTCSDAEVVLSADSWRSLAEAGYLVFFPASSTRDWPGFASRVRSVLQDPKNSSARVGWIDDSDGAFTLSSFLPLVLQKGRAPTVQAFSWTLRNLTLNLAVPAFDDPPAITFDDSLNALTIVNPGVEGSKAFGIVVAPPGGSQVTLPSPAATISIAVGGPAVGALNARFDFCAVDLAQFEAGLAYFAPGPRGGPLRALSYPTFLSPSGPAATLGFDGWFDVLAPLDDTRTYFQFTDPIVGSYLATATGRPVHLGTTNGTDVTRTSRLVLANRPVQAPSDDDYYYLTPAGQFTLRGVGDGSAGAGAVKPVRLLCGVMGTEFLECQAGPAAGDGPGDLITFVPGQAALQAPPDVPGPRLVSAEGQVTTSWVRVTAPAGRYVSQPESSPLYQQRAGAAEVADADGLNVHVLDFLPLSTWVAEPGVDGATTPLVPVAPYAGLAGSTAGDVVASYLAMEATALSPTRRGAFTAAAEAAVSARPAGDIDADAAMSYAMTPQGLLAGVTGSDPQWSSLQVATSADGPVELGFGASGTVMRQVLQQNQVFAVISRSNGHFDFTQSKIDIGGWTFDLSPDGLPDPSGNPPILLLKFYPGRSIASLVDDRSLWSQPDAFNVAPFGPAEAQAYLKGVIQDACLAVYGEGNCPDGVPGGQPDTNSLYYDFYAAVTDPSFSGVLVVNGNVSLDHLPAAIKGVLGGMTDPGIAGFRVHHAGVRINDTDPAAAEPTLAQSSLFALVDYESAVGSVQPPGEGFYHFEVAYLRALFTNAELRDFACRIDLTIDGLFGSSTTLNATASSAANLGAGAPNTISIVGSYQAHSTSNDDTTSGQGVYSFITEGNFVFDFASSPYLESITLTKLQFSFDNEAPASGKADTTRISAGFGIWGSIVFKDLDVLDIFAFEKLVFADLGIDLSFELTSSPGSQPSTGPLALRFAPGNLRLDLGETKARKGSTSLLDLLPFRLRSFLYSEDGETLESQQYVGLDAVPGLGSVNDRFNYGLIFDLDLGSLGALVGSLAAFKFSVLIGWLDGDDAGIAFGMQLPQADGKLEITIEGVLTISIQQLTLLYATSGADPMLVVGLQDAYVSVLGKRLPPTGTVSFALFAPTAGAAQIGWLAAYNEGQDGGAGEAPSEVALDPAPAAPGSDPGDDGKVFELVYLGAGQRTGPDPASPPTTFADFLDFMQGDFWTAVKDKKFDEVYHPDGEWLVVTDFKLVGIIEVGIVYYDVTPFYSLVVNVEKLFNFEITYTKVTDSIGLYYANLSLPDSLRTFQVGAASLTLPSLGISVYTNGNWKVDVGFPVGDDWSHSFQVEAMAGPVPVTGAGGFYLASLSSATSPDTFKGNYPSILAFGFAARLGVGKSFVAGPLKAGISVTFFGIIEGSAGYLSSGSSDIFRTPDALSLSGQFGIIGELYGSLDFVVVKASVNVRLSASIGIVVVYEPSAGDDGSILLYIEASVNVSVKVTINLFLFSIHLSFSFKASFRFQWQLAGTSTSQVPLAAAMPRALAAPEAALARCSGLDASVGLWFLPELTVAFTDAASTGEASLVCSLGIEYDDDPPAAPTYADLKAFETVTAQLVTAALGHVLGLSGCSATVTREQLQQLDQDPGQLVGWLDYQTLLDQLAVFDIAIGVPTGSNGDQKFATVFPMFPFLALATEGRLDASGAADDLAYTFDEQNVMPASYYAEVEAYLSQLFVNQTDQPATQAAEADDAGTSLVQEIFVNYLQGLVRGAVHQLLVTLEDQSSADSMALDSLICETVANRGLLNLAGQMSSSFRGGTRLPFATGLTVPGGSPDQDTNPLYGLLWQQFSVGAFDAKAPSYAVRLTNPDSSTSWVTTTVDYSLAESLVEPYTGIEAGSVAVPGTPEALAFTDSGPQAFPLSNALAWTPAGATAPLSLRSFALNLMQLQRSLADPIAVVVESRAGGAPYLPGGIPLATTEFRWTTTVEVTVAQVPAPSGSGVLEDVFALSGANQADQLLLQQILAGTGDQSIEAIQILFQSAAGAAGLVSGDTSSKPQEVFLLRTNTTTVSAPPTALLAAGLASVDSVAVGAAIDDHTGFLQILQQAAVTNAGGYYLRYRDAENKTLPTDLFTSGPASLTVLIEWAAPASNTPTSPASVASFFNGVVLTEPNPELVYYAQTTDPALGVQHPAVAAGSVGAVLTRAEEVMALRPPPSVAAMAECTAGEPVDRTALIQALVASGATSDDDLHAALTDSGAATAQLNALYSLLTYRVQRSTGFVASNLAASIQPQKADSGDTTSSYRAFVPLYKLAEANQALPSGQPPDRYASIDDAFSVEFFLNDAFGNQLPNPQSFTGTNAYFDPIIPLDQWVGVVATYGFGPGPAGSRNLTCTLTPSADALGGPNGATTTLPHYQQISDQITGQGVSFAIETNLAVDTDGSPVRVQVDAAGAADIQGLVSGIVAYLQGGALPSPVTLTVEVPAGSSVPPVFEISVFFAITRDPALIASSLKNADGVVTFPSAQNVNSAVPSMVGASTSIGAFSAAFVEAFPELALSVALTGTDAPVEQGSSTGRARGQLRALGVATDASGDSHDAAQSLWAVQRSVLDVKIGAGSAGGPRFLSPRPLDNKLNSATVALPQLDDKLPQLPGSAQFVDVDLDEYNRSFFTAVDMVLAPASAAAAYATAPSAYDQLARGRQQLSSRYADHEVDWLFGADSPFTGTPEALAAGREVFAQQMRASLRSAYSVDTIVQYDTAWEGLPSSVDGMLELFGQVRPTPPVAGVKGGEVTGAPAAGLSTANVAVRSDGSGALTFLYSSPDIEDSAQVTFAHGLELDVTHVQHFLTPAGSNPTHEARPSLWLQLVDPYPSGAPAIGRAGEAVVIPVVLRQYPTPPTVLSQSWEPAPRDVGSNALVDLAGWNCLASYQAQLTAHDQVAASLTFNTDLSATPSPTTLTQAADVPAYSLFEALARFHATYGAVRPILADLGHPDWALAVSALADRVAEVVANTDWNPTTAMEAGSPLARVVDRYTITDLAGTGGGGARVITLAWPSAQGQSSFGGVELSIAAADPASGVAYPGQVIDRPAGADHLTDTYTPSPPLMDDWVLHQVTVGPLNVLAAENALVGVQVERNRVSLDGPDGSSWAARDEFVYTTPLVRPTQPVTPFIEAGGLIDVAHLPGQGQGESCPSPAPAALCQRIYTVMNDLLADPRQVSSLQSAHRRAGLSEGAPRRMKVACGFRYPMPAVTGGDPGSTPISPLVPVALARSFVIDATDSDQLGSLAQALAEAISTWASTEDVAFGSSAKPDGAQLVLHLTLYAQLSSANTPIISYSDVALRLADVASSS